MLSLVGKVWVINSQYNEASRQPLKNGQLATIWTVLTAIFSHWVAVSKEV